ncbi:MAG: sporulation transcriptional regulator SpoIIID [Clostridia bacterium]|nr:sporulation transcriptional regulator SpoIIID [Clostridia bacterium]
MQNYIIERVEEVADYIIQTESTLRDTAEVFMISKSTAHTDMTIRLPQIDSVKYEKVREVLDKNLAERHIRGGHSTQLKYSHT